MAATSRSRSQGSSRGQRGRSSNATASRWTVGPRALSWLRRFGVALRGSLPSVAVSDRFRREIVGAGFVLLALFSGWALGRGAQDGPIAAWWGDGLRHACGRAAGLIPVFLALTAIRAFRDHSGPVLLPRHYVGGLGYALSATGLLHLATGESSDRPGGYLGHTVARVAEGGLGQLTSGLVLVAVGVVSVFLLADMDVRTLESEIRALWPRKVDSPTPDDASAPPEVDMVSPPKPAVRQLEVTPPVVNVPQRDSAAANRPAVPAAAAGKNGKPLPLPDLAKLTLYEGTEPDKIDLQRRAALIEETLASFRVEARVREINPGPTVTQFALEPGIGVPVRRILSLDKDLALALAAPSIRIEAPVPGMARVGIEIPNAELTLVGLREVLESSVFVKGKTKLPIPLGRDVNGRYVVGDLTKMPHLLIAGQTGSGKSVCLNVIVSTLLLTRSPEDLKLLMIDPKMVEMTGYNGVPHLQCPVVTEMDKVVGALRLTLKEMQRRYDLFAKLGVRNLEGYRLKTADEPGVHEHLPYLVVIIDELADLMMTAPDDVEGLLVRLAQLARATGIHLIIATQRPTVDVLTGLIKANVPSRIAFAVASGVDSRVILDIPGAEHLLGKGDMLYAPPEAAKPQRVQCAFIEDKDIHYIVDHWHSVAPVPEYAREWLELPSSGLSDEVEGEEDPCWEQALEIVRKSGTASASMLQRKLRVGYNRAARLIERMEDEGIIGPADGLRGRPYLLEDE